MAYGLGEGDSIDLNKTCTNLVEPAQSLGDIDWRSAQERLWLMEPIMTDHLRLDPKYLELDNACEALTYTDTANRIIELSKTRSTTEASDCPAGRTKMSEALLEFCNVVWHDQISETQRAS